MLPTKGRFVNKVRGLGFLEISLNDFAIKLFDSSLGHRSNLRNANVSPKNGGGGESVTQRRDSWSRGTRQEAWVAIMMPWEEEFRKVLIRGDPKKEEIEPKG
ncbi:hypothetical protein SLA2020_486960 [Shorea laevis]